MLNRLEPRQNIPVEIPENLEKNHKLSNTARGLVILSLAVGVLSSIGVIAFTIAAAVTTTPAFLIGSLICGIALAIILGRSISHCCPKKRVERERIIDPPSPFTESLYVDHYAIHPHQDRGIINWTNEGFHDREHTALFADRVIPNQR